jgi:TolA-binding protein
MSTKLSSGDKARCKQQVVSPGMRGMFTHQCSRKVWKDGFCKLHHPETVAIRDVKKTEAYYERQKNSPWNIISEYREKLDKANARVAELEQEVTELKIQKEIQS